MLSWANVVQDPFLKRTAVPGMLVVVLVGAVLGGCDTTVSIFEEPGEEGLYFSLYGQVGPDGGTVRVERLRDSIDVGAPPSAPETVTLTRQRTGAVDTLRRSERQIREVSVHNYRVPPLEPAEDYRIEVEGRRGQTTSVVVQVPRRPPAITVLDTLRYCNPSLPRGEERQSLPVRVRVDSVERIGRVAATYTRDRERVTGRYTLAAKKINDGSFRVVLRTEPELTELYVELFGPVFFETPPPAFTENMQVAVAAVGPGWPGREFNMAQLEEYTAPNRFSNVRQGVGLVVGTYRAREDVPVKIPETGSGEDLPSCPPNWREEFFES